MEIRRRTTECVDVYEDLAPPSAGQVPGTMSLVRDHYDNNVGALLGTFHAYRKPDGTLGASGMWDPIFLLVNGIPHVDP